VISIGASRDPLALDAERGSGVGRDIGVGVRGGEDRAQERSSWRDIFCSA
jgi:hypothetical protein